MDMERLRAETRAQHEAVESTEGLTPLTAADLTREQYAATLRRMYAPVAGWEDWAVRNAPAHLAAMVRERRRSVLIEQDLAYLGQAAPSSSSSGKALDWLLDNTEPEVFEARFLGAMYVMEGSTLGGQYIAGHVEALLGFAPGVGDAYFRGYGTQTGVMWSTFKAVLAALPEAQSENVIAAAKAMFAYFGDSLQAAANAPAY